MIVLYEYYINNFNQTQTGINMSTTTNEQKKGINLNFGFAAFEMVIAENFRSIQSRLAQQQTEIGRLNELLLGTDKNIIQGKELRNEEQSKKEEKNDEKSNITFEVIGKMIDNKTKNGEVEVASLPKQVETKHGTIQLPSNNNIPQPISTQNPILPPQNQLNQTDISLSDVGIKMIQSDIMQQKVFELFERVRQLEEKQANSERFSLKKFREMDFQVVEGVQNSEKTKKAIEQFEDTVEALRNQISEYKLKKQSKIMKALNSSSIASNQATSGENYDYMAQKLQFLLKHVSQMITKKHFQEERETLHFSIDALRRKMNENISQTFFQESMKALEARIYQSVAKHIKAIQFSSNEKGSDQLDSIIEEGNRQFMQRVNQHSEKLKVFNEQLTMLKAAIDVHRKQRINFEQQCTDLIRMNQQKSDILTQQLQDIKKYVQQMKQAFQSKHLQSQNQIIQLQESLDKVINNFKSLSFTVTNRESPMKTQYPLNDNPESQLLPEKVNSNISNTQLENDFKSQQKKFNKLHGKVQGLKQDILNFREDLMREIDGVKAGLQKKADWQSLRKGLNYFQQKLKQTKAVTQALYETTIKQQDGSLAVKKGWTCLVCDKDIRSFQGKLGQLKFTSMFPIRQSPRIGGYYKQQQATQEYRQIFMSNGSLNNNRSRRIGSLKSKESKEELH